MSAQKDDYKVKTIPGIPAINVDMHAGHIPTIGDTEYFFWLFNSKNKSNKLVIWLNGGPGCSSMDGVFLENGPFRFNGTTLVENKHSWYANANMLYLDQPAGTGYSISPEKNFAKNQDDVNRHFLAFLDHFYKIFDNFKDHELFIAGESYAGTWIPHITLAILNRNKKSPELYLPIKSILIGNGWIDPIYQLVFAEKHGLLKGTFLEEAQLAMETCRNELHKLPSITNQHCEGVMDSILDYSKQDGKYCLNKYDIRLHDKGPNEGCGMSWPTGVYEMKDYLARHDVRNALHAQKYTSKSWTECSWSVYQHIVSDPTPPSITVFPALLEQLPINLFVGDQDLICNILGFKNMITLLTWNGAQGIDKEETAFSDKDSTFGTILSDRNLTLYTLTGGSHMPAFDVPEASLAMFEQSIGVVSNSVESDTTSTTTHATVTVTMKTTSSLSTLTNIPSEANSQADPIPNETLEPSHFGAGLFVIMFLICSLYVGFFMRKRLRNLTTPRQTWESVPDDEDIELRTRRRDDHPTFEEELRDFE